MTLRAPREGEPLSSSQWFQPVADRLNRQAGVKTTDTPPNAQSSAAVAGVDSGAIVFEKSDTIAVLLDAEDRVVTVAKPPALRGAIGTRINAADETEEIFPAYSPGVRVLIAEVTETGVDGVTWADLNWGARRWTIEV